MGLSDVPVNTAVSTRDKCRQYWMPCHTRFREYCTFSTKNGCQVSQGINPAHNDLCHRSSACLRAQFSSGVKLDHKFPFMPTVTQNSRARTSGETECICSESYGVLPPAARRPISCWPSVCRLQLGCWHHDEAPRSSRHELLKFTDLLGILSPLPLLVALTLCDFQFENQ